VRRRDDVAAVLAQDPDALLDLAGELLVAAAGQQALLVDGAPEAELVADEVLELLRAVSGNAGLDGVEDLDAHLDEVVQDRLDGAVAVEGDDDVGVRLLEGVEHLLVERLDVVAEQMLVDEQRRLRAEVVAGPDHVDAAADELEADLGLELDAALVEPVDVGLLHLQVAQHLLHAQKLLGELEHRDLDVADHDVVLLVLGDDLLGLRVAGGLVRIGELVGLDLLDGLDPGERGADDVDVHGALAHLHVVLVVPGTVLRDLGLPARGRGRAAEHQIRAHLHAQLVGADAPGDVLVNVVRDVDGDAVLLGEILDVLLAQVELDRHAIRISVHPFDRLQHTFSCIHIVSPPCFDPFRRPLFRHPALLPLLGAAMPVRNNRILLLLNATIFLSAFCSHLKFS